MAGQLAANHPDDALQYLREAINRGYKDADGLMADPDLEKLHPNPNFQRKRSAETALTTHFSSEVSTRIEGSESGQVILWGSIAG